jgi:hypothetical protein
MYFFKSINLLLQNRSKFDLYGKHPYKFAYVETAYIFFLALTLQIRTVIKSLIAR